MSKARHVATIIVAVALLATACADANTVSSFGEREEGQVDDSVLVAAEDLPSAFSPIRSVGDLGFYFAIVDEQMQLIAFDAATGQGAYQLSAHPLGRSRSAGQDLIVDDDLGLVFVTGTTDEASESSAFLAAHDAPTGALVWQQPIDYFSAQPRDCESSLCLRSAGRQTVIDKTTGMVVDSYQVSDRQVLLDDPSLWLTIRTSAVGRFLGLIGSLPADRGQLWDIPADIIEDMTGTRVDPLAGARVDYDPETQTAIAYMANAEQTAWVAFGLDTAAGRVTWGNNFNPCVQSPFQDRPPLVCVVDEATGGLREIGLLNPATGRGRWVLDLDDSVTSVIFDGVDLVVWRGTIHRRVALDTGRERDNGTPALCAVPNEAAEFAFPDGQRALWAAARTYSLCGTDGSFLEPAEAVAEAAEIRLDGRELWIVDGDGVPIAPIDG